MLRGLALALAISAGLPMPSLAQTAEQAVEISRVEAIGRDLFDHDRAAWLATDALFAEMGTGAQSQLRGWITERVGASVVVTFVADGQDESMYRAVYQGGALVEHGAAREPLSVTQLRLFSARQIATIALQQPCSEAYNSITLPREGEDVVDVYLVPGTTDPNAILVGGYYRVAVGASGEIVETQAFSRSCLTLRTDDPSLAGSQLDTLWFNHLVTPLPTETHVFISLLQSIPLLVVTRSGIWRIAGGRISLAREAPQ